VDEPVPIGRPIAGTEVRVLDESGALVPIGVPGELYLGGDALARGYLEDPERTAAVFVPGSDTSARRYRTGDRVRWRADGRLVFLGRVDEQVKVRGVRVEPGEIEAVLCRHPAVEAAAVIAREAAPAEYQLVAYVAPVAGASPDELRRFLAARLPSAMVPAVFVPLPSLPLTPGGKVDRRGLPAPAAPQPRTTAPRSPMEVILARLWSEVLRLPEVDVDDDFFHLGGHSLLATQLISRLRDAIGVEVSLRHFFEHPTIARLAATLAEAPRAQPSANDLRSRPRAEMPGLLDRIDELSEAQVDALLAELLHTEDPP
jgi:acyl carrier protein